MAAGLFSDSDLGPQELQQNILTTYINIRTGTAIVGIVFPLILWLGGRLYARLCLQGSMSAYYHATGVTGQSMRDWFVGLLFVVGIFLVLYKGYSHAENWALNIAGILALGVAVFPMHWDPCYLLVCNTSPRPCPASTEWITLHGSCAIGLFVCIAYVALFRSDDTLELINDTNLPNPARLIARLKQTYRLIGVVMIGSTVAAYVINTVFKSEVRTFWVEATGIISFGIYWLVKSWELGKTAADLKTIRAQVRRTGGKIESIAPASGSGG